MGEKTKMIPKITLIPQNNTYKTNYSNNNCSRPYFGTQLSTDMFNKEPVSLEKAVKMLCASLKENVFIKLLDDADPLRSLSNMSLGIEKLTTQNKMSVNLKYITPDNGNCSVPVLTGNSADELKNKMQNPNFVNELTAKIQKASLKELVPDDYHDSLD